MDPGSACVRCPEPSRAGDENTGSGRSATGCVPCPGPDWKSTLQAPGADSVEFRVGLGVCGCASPSTFGGRLPPHSHNHVLTHPLFLAAGRGRGRAGRVMREWVGSSEASSPGVHAATGVDVAGIGPYSTQRGSATARLRLSASGPRARHPPAGRGLDAPVEPQSAPNSWRGQSCQTLTSSSSS